VLIDDQVQRPVWPIGSMRCGKLRHRPRRRLSWPWPGRERLCCTPLLRFQISDDVGPLIGVWDALKRQCHRRVWNHRLGIVSTCRYFPRAIPSRSLRASSFRRNTWFSRRSSRPCARRCHSTLARLASWRRDRPDDKFPTSRRKPPCPCRRRLRQRPIRPWGRQWFSVCGAREKSAHGHICGGHGQCPLPPSKSP
jgi:hypothetical protein